MNYQISQETIQKVAAYLATKPWQEVHSLIQELASVTPLETKKEESE